MSGPTEEEKEILEQEFKKQMRKKDKERIKKGKDRKKQSHKEQVAEMSAVKVRKHFDVTMQRLVEGTAKTISTVTLQMRSEVIKYLSDLMAPLYKEAKRAQKEEERMSGLIQCLIQVDKITLEKIEENREMITKSAGASAGALEALRKEFMLIHIVHLEKHVRWSYFEIAFYLALAAGMASILFGQAGLL